MISAQSPAATAGASAAPVDPRVQAIREFLALRRDLEARGFGEAQLASLRELGGPALFRTLVPDGPCFVGFVGCTKVGKSTLFNSLFGEEISPIDWRAHTTRSPIFLIHRGALDRIRQVEAGAGPLLLPDQRVCMVEEHGRLRWQDAAATYLVPHERDELASLVLVDLPDTNSRAAQLEGDVALEMMPWLDAVIFVLTEQTAFDRSLERYLTLRRDLGLRSLVVLQRQEGGGAAVNDVLLRQRAQELGCAHIHVLPAIKGRLFSGRPEFVEFRKAVLVLRDRSPVDALVESLARTAQGLIAANRERERHLRELSAGLARTAAGFRPQLTFDPRSLVPPAVLRLLALRGLGGWSLVNQARALPLAEPGRWVEVLSSAAWRLRVERLAERIGQVDLTPARQALRARLEALHQDLQATWKTSAYAADLAGSGAGGPGACDLADAPRPEPFGAAVSSCLQAVCGFLREPGRRPGARQEAIAWPIAAALVFLHVWPELSTVIAVLAWVRILVPELLRVMTPGEAELRFRVCAEQVEDLMADPYQRLVEHFRPERFSQMVLREDEREFQVLRRIADLGGTGPS